jgi:hypothetical protein
MKYLSGTPHSLLLVAGTALLLFGCGGGKGGGTIEGKVVRNGTPITVAETDILNLSFLGADSKAFGGVVNKDGTFVVNDIPPGHYKLRLTLTAGSNDPASMAKSEKEGKQYNAVNNKLEYEVGGSETITIDIENGTVTKK